MLDRIDKTLDLIIIFVQLYECSEAAIRCDVILLHEETCSNWLPAASYADPLTLW